MSKTERLLMLVSLLSHNKVVTMEQIQAICGIPRRTAYRYLNTISEANIPVYYDKQAGGYRLTKKVVLPGKQLSLHEAAVLAACLRYCQQHVNTEYRQQLQVIGAKLSSSHPLLLDQTQRTTCSAMERAVAPDYSEDINFELVNVAIANNRELLVLTASADRQDRIPLQITKPKLRFCRGWHVTGETAGRSVKVNFADIRGIRLA